MSSQQLGNLTVAILPDSFKGSASAQEIAEAMASGVRRAAEGRSLELTVHALPFADGGEGTLDAICSAWGVQPREAEVTDALGRPVRARYALSADGAAGLIEAAEANGLPRVSDVPLEPLRAGTFGVGQLAAHLLDEGCAEILLCIGGSATTDGGAGILQALGVRLLDDHGQDLLPGGEALTSLATIDTTGLHPRAQQVRWRIACDVTNPLIGDRGAAAVFGPQKGAGPDEVETLDAGLARFAGLLAEQSGQDVRSEPGMGAAGGIPAALSLFGAEIVPGGELVAETLGVREILAGADLVLTGEGKLDTQSAHGKVVSTIRRLTPPQIPVMVLAGAVDLSGEELVAAGIAAALPVSDPSLTQEQMYASTLPNAESAAQRAVALFLGEAQ